MRAVRSVRRGITAVLATAAATALAAAVTALPAEAAPAEGRVLGAGSPTAVPGSYLVTLKDDVGFKATAARGKDLITGYGGTVERTYTSALNGYSATLSSGQARRLAADPDVASVEQDQVVHTLGTQTGAPWGLDRIDQSTLPLSGTYTSPDHGGSGSTVYVLDTGVRITHQDIAGRASYGWDFVDGDATAQDGYGHGTFVATVAAGTTYGVAKKAKVVAVRVLGNDGSGTTAGVVAGVDWITAHHVADSVANVSLGGGASTTLDTAVNNSIASGVTYSIAAGNSGALASGYSPARVAAAITVGATTSADARASYSNYGSAVDLFAPGSGITAAWNTSDSATYTGNGTSFAAPHVSGAAALYLTAHPGSSPAAVASALVGGATDGVLTGVGTGSPNKLLKLVP
ncbi:MULTISPECIES: S8 family peptidase [Streptomyces]|uniref:S8 family peptidase n=1 Tax=Streptomyces doudnae TaxID=3075536 RepID=A0ABD5EVP0_9ACTN|nr:MULTISPECIES: S8 family peptidase [unclassified Streptomyces]MDT0438318.1 S8 family peptidase [Streptomyces sp. DSM 41981]MYQ68341.1 S8 family serine peptidase [Streptomyces sp. SID4950]SCE45289.1 Serine protease, subtilisin family [Streptomyces sp. SolWspMP-5a-2]